MGKILLTLAEAATLCGLGEKKFRAAMRAAGIEPVQLGERTVRWRTADVQRWADGLATAAGRGEPPQLAAGKARARARESAGSSIAAQP